MFCPFLPACRSGRYGFGARCRKDCSIPSGFGSWFSRNIIGIIPIKRGGAARGEDVLLGAKEALTRGEILVVFPEGSRGEPEEMTRFKTGVARLVEFCPEAAVTPVLRAPDRPLASVFSSTRTVRSRA